MFNMLIILFYYIYVQHVNNINITHTNVKHVNSRQLLILMLNMLIILLNHIYVQHVNNITLLYLCSTC